MHNLIMTVFLKDIEACFECGALHLKISRLNYNKCFFCGKAYGEDIIV